MKRIDLVTPALANPRGKGNNGNGHTAMRWANFLSLNYHVNPILSWQIDNSDALIALHARRSAESVSMFHSTGKPIALVLTGTDLYRDIQTDLSAQRSLELAHLLVTLQPDGIKHLPSKYHEKTRCIFQSCPSQTALPSRKRTLDLVWVGHLRKEKDPLTAVLAVHQSAIPKLRLRIIGDILDERLGQQIRDISNQDSRIELLGSLTHAATLKEIRQASALICSSSMEGGANVVIEAVVSETPVLASKISGNVGLLGSDYSGFFEQGKPEALVRLIELFHADPSFASGLTQQCASRKPLFHPNAERQAVLELAADLLNIDSKRRT